MNQNDDWNDKYDDDGPPPFLNGGGRVGARSRVRGSMRRKQRGGKKGRRGGGGTRGIQVWGKRGKAKEGHKETFREVVCSVNVQLVVPVLRLLHGAAIIRQARMKRLATEHCAARIHGLHASDVSLQLTLHVVKKRLVGDPIEGLPPGNQLRLLLRCQWLHHPRAVHCLLLRHLHLHPQIVLVGHQLRGRQRLHEKARCDDLKIAHILRHPLNSHRPDLPFRVSRQRRLPPWQSYRLLLQSRLYQIIVCSVLTVSCPSCGAPVVLT